MIKRLLILLLLAAPLQGATYYVSTSGDDGNAGTTTGTTWKTLNKIAITTFATGDTVLLKRGDTFYGDFSKPLWVTGYNGTANDRFYIGAYGEGDKPKIIMDCSNLEWSIVDGYDSIYVASAIGFCYSSIGYDNIDGVQTRMTQYSDGISNIANPDTLIKLLNAMVPSSYIGAHRNMPVDKVYLRTHDGGAPNVKILRNNFFKAEYLTIENIEFYNGFHALNAYPSNFGEFRNLYFRNFIGITFFLAGYSSENLVEYCCVDSGAYTAFYSWYSHRNLYQYDTVQVIRDTIMGIYSNIEQAGFGAERDTGTVWQYCAAYDCDDSGWDTFFNCNDTIRHSLSYNCGKAITLQGVGWVCHDNVCVSNPNTFANAGIKVDISYIWGENTYLTTAGQTHVYNNTVTAKGSGLWVGSVAEGSSVLFENNIVQGLASNTNLTRYESGDIVSTNNNFCGIGRWNAGEWPDDENYATLALYQSATGYEAGSTYDLVCPEAGEDPDIFTSSCDAFGNVLIDATSTKTFTLAGEYLTPAADNLTVTGVAGFTISLSEYTGYTSSLSVPYTGGTLAATTIYVKFSPNEEKSYSGNLVCSGGGAISENVAVSGNGVTPVQPPEGDALYLPIIP